VCDNSNRLVVCTSNKSNGSHTGNLTYFMIVWWGRRRGGGAREGLEKGRGDECFVQAYPFRDIPPS